MSEEDERDAHRGTWNEFLDTDTNHDPWNELVSTSGSLWNAYADLRGTFDTRQQSIVQQMNMEQNLRRLVELTERGQIETKKREETMNTRFYISTAIAIISAIIAIISLVAVFL